MGEVRRVYQLANVDINELNSIFAQIADRLDQVEGYRGIPTFLAPPVGKTAGSSDEIPILGQLSSIISALNEIYPPTYGEMFIDTAADYTLTLQSTWYQITGFTSGHEDNVEFESVYDHMVLPAGDYIFLMFCSVALTGTNQEAVFSFALDGTQLNDHQIRRMFATIDTGAVAMGGFESVTEGQKLSIWAMNDTSAGKTLTVNRMTVIAYRIHGA